MMINPIFYDKETKKKYEEGGIPIFTVSVTNKNVTIGRLCRGVMEPYNVLSHDAGRAIAIHILERLAEYEVE